MHRSGVIAVGVVLASIAAACSGSDDPSVEITKPEIGTVVNGNVVELAIDVSGIEIVPAEDDPGDGDTGHFHVFIDRDPVAPGAAIPADDPSVVHSAANPIQLVGLSAGEHRMVVVLGDKDDIRIGDAVAETEVTVNGPTIDVTGPETAEVGAVIQVDVAVAGVNLVEAVDDKSNKDGSTGQLYMFVNKEPTLPGETIPDDDPAIIQTTSTSVAFPADLFKEGTNTIWVMLGHADQTPYDPRVLDKVVVELS